MVFLFFLFELGVMIHVASLRQLRTGVSAWVHSQPLHEITETVGGERKRSRKEYEDELLAQLRDVETWHWETLLNRLPESMRERALVARQWLREAPFEQITEVCAGQCASREEYEALLLDEYREQLGVQRGFPPLLTSVRIRTAECGGRVLEVLDNQGCARVVPWGSGLYRESQIGTAVCCSVPKVQVTC